MNLCSRGRKEAGRRGGEGYRTRTLRRAYGGLQQPPSAFKNNTEPYTSRRGAGRRCLARRRPQRCGRGEAAGDCVNVARALSTAAEVARTARTGYAGCSSPGVLLRPGSTGSLEQDYKTRNEFKGGRTQGGEQRDQGRGRHDIRNSAGTRRVEHGARAWSARQLVRHGYAALQEQARRSLQGRSSRSPPTTRPRETAWRQRGVFTSGFPPSRGGPRPSASPFSQT